VARLYADENVPLALAEALRSLGHDVLTVREAGYDNQRISDADVLLFAITTGRALLTLNRRDFIRLHRQMPDHRGVIICTEDSDTQGQAERIHSALESAGDLAGVLLRINRPSR
jgi:predicted nuclease of predicted toxin-antitoxin system